MHHPIRAYTFRVISALFALFAAMGTASPASAANVLCVSDFDVNSDFPAILMVDGHTVTLVTNDMSRPVSVLAGALDTYDAIIWTGSFSSRPAAIYSNLTAYVMAGGRVLYTGYDSARTNPGIQGLLGATGGYDFPSAPGPIVMADNALTTGILDIRGVTPTGGYSDRDGITGLIPTTISVSRDTGGSGHEWTLRTLGDGFVAWVSNSASGGNHVSWSTTTGTLGARAYNAALRNFVFNSGGFAGTCTGAEGSACTSASGRAGICHTSRCCIGCWDGTRCYAGTSADRCAIGGGACASCSDGMPCSLDVCTAGVCSNPDAPTGHACEDGEFCTVGETCDDANVCSGGRENTCDDMNVCSADSCNEATNACDHVPGGSGCYIDGECWGAFTINPSNVCQSCNPLMTNTAWSPRTVGIMCGTAVCSGAPGSAMFDDGGRCDATGACVESEPRACPQGVCESGTRCATECSPGSCGPDRTCSTTSHSCVARAAIGGRCGAGSDCMSGFCADGLCCSTACDELCDSCDLDDNEGTCLPTPVGGSCGSPTCSGASITLPGECTAEGVCDRGAPRRCPNGRCDSAMSCAATCTPDSCAPGEICTEGLLCVTPAEDGGECGADDHCISGFCVDGVCCNRACDDFCQTCDLPGRVGRCTPYSMGTDPELDCPEGSVCNGGSGCMLLPDAGPPDAGGGPHEERTCSCSAPGSTAPSGTALFAMLCLGSIVIARRRRRG